MCGYGQVHTIIHIKSLVLQHIDKKLDASHQVKQPSNVNIIE